MSAQRRHLAAVPGEGERGPELEVRERARLLTAVEECGRPGCTGSVRVLDTIYGRMVFEAEPVELTDELVKAEAAYLIYRCVERSIQVVVRAGDLPQGAVSSCDTALTPHVCTSILETQGAGTYR